MFVNNRTDLVAASILFLGVSGICRAQPVAEVPEFKVGDSWELSQTTTPGDKRTTLTRKITEVGPGDQIQVEWENGSAQRYDSAMNYIPEGKVEYKRVLVRYPLKVGAEWSYTRKFTNPMLEEKGEAKVVAFETITVPAGTFECYRVDVRAEFAARNYQQKNTWSRWYCPKIKWVAKERHETYIFNPGAGGASTTVDTTELVKFTPGS